MQGKISETTKIHRVHDRWISWMQISKVHLWSGSKIGKWQFPEKGGDLKRGDHTPKDYDSQEHFSQNLYQFWQVTITLTTRCLSMALKLSTYNKGKYFPSPVNLNYTE